jgi:hypothetical protein
MRGSMEEQPLPCAAPHGIFQRSEHRVSITTLARYGEFSSVFALFDLTEQIAFHFLIVLIIESLIKEEPEANHHHNRRG